MKPFKNPESILCREVSELQIYNEVPALIYLSDNTTQTILWCNSFFEKATGYTLQEAYSMGIEFFRTVMHPDDFPEAVRAQQELKNGKSRFTGYCRFKPKNGKEWHRLFGRAVPFDYNDKGDIKRALVLLIELNDRPDTPIQAEEAFRGFLRKKNEHILTTLSEREKEVLELLATGKSREAIAGKLYISMFTLDEHLKHLKNKLDVHKTPELVALAKDMGF